MRSTFQRPDDAAEPSPQTIVDDGPGPATPVAQPVRSKRQRLPARSPATAMSSTKSELRSYAAAVERPNVFGGAGSGALLVLICASLVPVARSMTKSDVRFAAASPLAGSTGVWFGSG